MRRQRKQINLFKYILFYCIKCLLFVINDTCINLTQILIYDSFTVQNPRTRLVKMDHVCFGYLATTSRLSALLQ